jgi:hypothetical protein
LNPRTILWQSAVTAALLIATVFLVAPATTLLVGGLGLVCALLLNSSYARVLGQRGRPARRIEGDRHVIGCLALALIAPMGVALVASQTDVVHDVEVWDFTRAEIAAIMVGACALFVLILLSSLIDWYYIRPRIDGVVWRPPCRSAGDRRWKRVTRRWYLHRGLATVAYVLFALVVALVIMLMLVREHPTAAGVIGGVGGIASLLLIFLGEHRSQLPTVATFVLSPRFSLGDDLRYDPDGRSRRGFVLHVAVPVTKLVPLDDHGRRTPTAFVERRNSELAASELEARVCVACDAGCVKLNPECVVGEVRFDSRRWRRGRRRLLVLW